jgi:hypothetical protein
MSGLQKEVLMLAADCATDLGLIIIGRKLHVILLLSVFVRALHDGLVGVLGKR